MLNVFVYALILRERRDALEFWDLQEMTDQLYVTSVVRYIIFYQLYELVVGVGLSKDLCPCAPQGPPGISGKQGPKGVQGTIVRISPSLHDYTQSNYLICVLELTYYSAPPSSFREFLDRKACQVHRVHQEVKGSRERMLSRGLQVPQEKRLIFFASVLLSN